MIISESNNTKTEYNDLLERQYLDLNNVEQYVVDNYNKFVVGVCSDEIHIDGYKICGIAKKLNSICNVSRMRTKKYFNLINRPYDKDIDGDRKLQIYTIKPHEDIKGIYNIIDYRNFEGGEVVKEK